MERDGRGRARPGAGERDAELATVMADLAAGDGAAVVTLLEGWGGPIRSTIRSIGRDRNVELNADQVDELAIDAVLELQAVASGWKAEFGVRPWAWGRARIANAVDRHLGQWADSLDTGGAASVALAGRSDGPAACATERPVMEVFGGLARTDDVVALLHEAVERVATPIDGEIFMEAAVQASLGDRSPAVTVAQIHGIRPDAVRQKQHRVRTRLRALAATEPRFAVLADLPLVA